MNNNAAVLCLRRATLCIRNTSLQCHRLYATAGASSPGLLLKLRGDLKTAMKSKDSDRLSVLRSLLAEVTNAAKTQSPIQTDIQLLSLLRKRAAAAKSAGEEFQNAGRQDLMEKENRQAVIMNEYARSIETLSEEDIRAAVQSVLETSEASLSNKRNVGDILKKLLGPGGVLDGQAVEKSEVARIVKQTLTVN